MITTYGFEQARKYGKVKLDKGIATLPFLIIRSSMNQKQRLFTIKEQLSKTNKSTLICFEAEGGLFSAERR
jgi:hypothetical protein